VLLSTKTSQRPTLFHVPSIFFERSEVMAETFSKPPNFVDHGIKRGLLRSRDSAERSTAINIQVGALNLPWGGNDEQE
jgi:hypothetical protein